MDIVSNIYHELMKLPYGGLWVVAIVCVLGILLFSQALRLDSGIAQLIHRSRPKHKRDSDRAFSNAMKSEASQQCNNRCEGTGILFRCSHVGGDLQGDHWFPHSLGGATSRENLVMLCPKCNRKKSNKIPTRLQTYSLSRRRRKHKDYSSREYTTVGQWLPRNYVSSKTPTRSKRSFLDRPSF